MTRPLALVVAVADNGVIGMTGGMPWRLRADLRWFARITRGKAVIMGRRTWESLPGPLLGRVNIVVSRTAPPQGGITLAPDLAAACQLAEATAPAAAGEHCVIGGASLYAEALPHCARLYVTRIAAQPAGDTFFHLPTQGPDWRVEVLETISADAENDFAARIEQWTRITGLAVTPTLA